MSKNDKERFEYLFKHLGKKVIGILPKKNSFSEINGYEVIFGSLYQLSVKYDSSTNKNTYFCLIKDADWNLTPTAIKVYDVYLEDEYDTFTELIETGYENYETEHQPF